MLLLDVLAAYLATCARFAPCSALQVECQRPDRTAPASGEVLLMPWGRREFGGRSYSEEFLDCFFSSAGSPKHRVGAWMAGKSPGSVSAGVWRCSEDAGVSGDSRISPCGRAVCWFLLEDVVALTESFPRVAADPGDSISSPTSARRGPCSCAIARWWQLCPARGAMSGALPCSDRRLFVGL